MVIEKFAITCGVTIVECGEGWGGKIGYKQVDYPNSSVCGFKTKEAAYKHWLKNKFGEQTSKEIVKLLRITDKIKNNK